MKRPDDQNRWQRFWREPSAGQRGWDYAHAWLATKPGAMEWRDTLQSHDACRAFDPTEFDRQFEAVIDFFLRHGYTPEAAPPAPTIVTPLLAAPVTTFVDQGHDCAICAKPGSTCAINAAYCPYLPR